MLLSDNSTGFIRRSVAGHTLRKWMVHFEFLDPDVRGLDGSRIWRVNLRINGRFIGIALEPGSRFVGRWGKGDYWIDPWGWPRNWR